MRGQAYEAMGAAARALRTIAAHNRKLNDPHGDGSGRDSEAPTGDDYNVVLDALEELAELLGITLH
jgi:hypothetical protein